MIFQKTPFDGLMSLAMEIHRDERGAFAEGFNIREFGLRLDQVNFSTSARKGTFRGLHYQDPNPQTKVVFCVAGTAIDVVVDMRLASRTYRKYLMFMLTPENARGVLVPAGFAHGWLSVEDRSQIIYFVEGAWSKQDERGVRYDDPAIGIDLPTPVSIVAPRDLQWPLLA